MNSTLIDTLHDDFNDLISLLNDNNEISLVSRVDDNFRKTLLVASASYYEKKIVEIIIEYCNEKTDNNSLLIEFIKNKALKRQYHTLFDWESNNANNFFSLFGKNFKIHMKEQIKDDDKLEDSITAFIEIGRERNRLIHSDYSSYSLEKTANEIYNMHKLAEYFVDNLPYKLREFNN